MSCQPFLLYSLIVERSVSHPVRLTAGVPLVTPRCPLPAACYCGNGGCKRRVGPCRMWDNTGKEEEGIPELCAEARSAECLWEHSSVTSSPCSSPEDRLCHPLTFCMWRQWEWSRVPSAFFILHLRRDNSIWLVSVEFTEAPYFNQPNLTFRSCIKPLR